MVVIHKNRIFADQKTEGILSPYILIEGNSMSFLLEKVKNGEVYEKVDGIFKFDFSLWSTSRM